LGHRAATAGAEDARGVEQQHASVIKLIRRHAARFERFGSLRFKIRVKRDDRFAKLNFEVCFENNEMRWYPLWYPRKRTMWRWFAPLRFGCIDH
jgi:hypothetical protein